MLIETIDLDRVLRKEVKPRNNKNVSKGVCNYAEYIVDSLIEIIGSDGLYSVYDVKTLEKVALNGAKDWMQYSKDGNSLIYDEQIATALYGKAEAKKIMAGGGAKRNNLVKEQGYALQKAWNLIERKLSSRSYWEKLR